VATFVLFDGRQRNDMRGQHKEQSEAGEKV
jgi:hypothetical protein